MPTSKSAFGRTCKQARRTFTGPKAMKGDGLTIKVVKRPQPSPEERERRREKLKRC